MLFATRFGRFATRAAAAGSTYGSAAAGVDRTSSISKYTFIPWKTTEELAKALQQRIEALGLSLKVNTV